MRDFIIKVKHQKIEIVILTLCFILAFALNMVAILIYKTQWKELYTQWYVVILLSFCIYTLTLFVRLILIGIKKIWKSISKR